MIRKHLCRYFNFKYLLYVVLISTVTIVYYVFNKDYSTNMTVGTTILFSHTTPVKTTTLSPQTTIENTNIVQPIGRPSCIPYIAPDNRSFFEREPPQLNLPPKVTYSSDQDLLNHVKSLRLHVLSTARDVANNIDKFRQHVEPIIDLFHPSSRILICESDSNDNTVDKLYQWPRAQVYTYGKISQSYPDRPERIAFCRNKLLNLTHQMTSDYILMVDMDVFATDVASFLTNFQYNTNDWAVMTASVKDVYYDIWALRTLSDSNLNYDVWHRIWDVSRYNTTYCSQSVTDQIIGIHQKHIPVERGLIEVRSAFNGAGLYKTNLTYGCQYSGAGTTCEHVPFHSCIRDNNHGRVFINPTFFLD